jgi:hypothetical protein
MLIKLVDWDGGFDVPKVYSCSVFARHMQQCRCKPTLRRTVIAVHCSSRQLQEAAMTTAEQQ